MFIRYIRTLKRHYESDFSKKKKKKKKYNGNPYNSPDYRKILQFV